MTDLQLKLTSIAKTTRDRLERAADGDPAGLKDEFRLAAEFGDLLSVFGENSEQASRDLLVAAEEVLRSTVGQYPEISRRSRVGSSAELAGLETSCLEAAASIVRGLGAVYRTLIGGAS